MTNKEAIDFIKTDISRLWDTPQNLEHKEALEMAIKVLGQKPCEDAISRKSMKQKLQEHRDFFVNAYGGFSNLPQNDKSRVDEITNCIAMVVNEPPVNPQEPKILETLDFAIDASNGGTDYFVGFRNGLRYSKSLVDGKEPQFENCTELKTGWIPVSEKLPKYNTPILLALKQIGKERTIVIGERRTRKSGWYFVDIAAYDTEHEVMAWMPLPKPYKASPIGAKFEEVKNEG